MSSKDEIQAAMKGGFKSEQFTLPGGQTLTVREMSFAEDLALNNANFPEGADGKPQANADGLNRLRWLRATLVPEFTVEELAEWPEAITYKIWLVAARLNGVKLAPEAAPADEVKEAAGNS